MTSLRRVGCLMLSLMAAPAVAQPRPESSSLRTEPAYYLAGDKRIELRPTDAYFALRVSADSDGLREKINASGVLRADRSELLDRYGLLLLRRTQGSSDAAVADVLRRVSFDPNDVPVFASKGIYLVLINDFSLQLGSRLPACVIETLAERYPQARFKRNDTVEGRYDVTVPNASARDALDMLNKLAQRERECVRFASPNFLMVSPREALSPPPKMTPGGPPVAFTADTEECQGTPNDSMFTLQWYLKSSTGADVRATHAWAVTTGAPTVVIAIIDDGVETTHPELADKISGQYDVVSNDADASPAEALDGHGTAVAGIAAAQTGNCEGIAGMGWQSRIYAVRAFESTSDSVLTIPTIVEQGIRKAITAGAKVINVSMSGGDSQPVIDAAIDAAIAAGRTLVLSAGNDNDGVNYPASLALEKTVIAVAATDKDDKLKKPGSSDGEPWGSNFGPEITVAAPGVRMLTTDRVGSAGFDQSSNYYRFFNGTSAATPLVAGVAALVLSLHPGASPASIREWIRCGADEVDAPGSEVRRLNAIRSLQAAANGCGEPSLPTPPDDLDIQ